MSCLFHSLGQLLSIPTNTVRQTICDYLADNNPILEGVPTADLLKLEHPSYVAHMRSASTWGGAIEIQVACILWESRILVENRRDRSAPTIEFLPLNGSYTKTLRIYWTGGHYEPIGSS